MIYACESVREYARCGTKWSSARARAASFGAVALRVESEALLVDEQERQLAAPHRALTAGIGFERRRNHALVDPYFVRSDVAAEAGLAHVGRRAILGGFDLVEHLTQGFVAGRDHLVQHFVGLAVADVDATHVGEHALLQAGSRPGAIRVIDAPREI